MSGAPMPRDCCFRPDSAMMPFETARGLAISQARPVGRREDVALAAAAGRVLAEAISAPQALPPFDQAAMDGYALRSGAGASPLPLLAVAGRTGAGDPPAVLAPGCAHRIMTGAAMPAGADAVVMQEDAIRHDDFVRISIAVRPGANIRHQGEDVRPGDMVLQAGQVIDWPEIGLLAALGIDSVAVMRPLRVAVVTTGSELRRAGMPLDPGAIHDANGPMLAALLAGPETEVASLTVPDDLAAMSQAFAGLAHACDLLVTAAGLSVGEQDYVRDALLSAGGSLDVVRVAMKPGKPLALGRLGPACFAGLPGNPQAAAVGALAFVRPMIAALLGMAPARRLTAALGFAHAGRGSRTELMPVRLSAIRDGLVAERCGRGGSHRMMPLASADAFAVLPEKPAGPGGIVEILPFCRLRNRPSRAQQFSFRIEDQRSSS